MAGAGAKKFPAFSKLTSDDVNNYLADQVVMRFATTTARDAAFGGAGEPTLAEGMTAYIDADNSIYTYDGSNWVKMVSASQPPALSLISVFLANGTSRSVDCDNVFTDEFQRYRIIGQIRSTVQTNSLFFQLRNSAGTALNTGYYSTTYGQDYASAGTGFQVNSANTVAYVGWIPNSVSSPFYYLSFSFDIFNTRSSSDVTSWNGQHTGLSSGSAFLAGAFYGTRTLGEINRGLVFDNGGAGNLTGSISVYGYR